VSVVEVVDAATLEVVQRRVGGFLHRAGLRPGDRLAVSGESSATLLAVVLGALRRGVVPVVLHHQLVDDERRRLLADADVQLTALEPAELAALTGGPTVDLAPYPLARPMHYTSGTDGRPKGVWSGVLDDAAARALFEDEADLWGFDPADTHLVCSPMSHSVSIRFAAGTVLRGGRLVILPHFDAAAAAGALQTYRPTTTFLAPTALRRLLDVAGLPDRLGGLRLLVHAGSACPPAVKRAALGRVADGVLWEFYGSTEGQFTVCAPDEWEARPGTVGRARPGRRLETDADGTIWCHTPDYTRFRYWGDPAATDRAWRGDAFTVGDLGRLDDDGYLFLDGRRDDLVISGGVNVYPAEVEAVLAEVPGVADVAVFGLPDDDWGERVCAAVTGSAAEVDLRRHAAAHLAPFKRPKAYFRVDDLPRTATGKIRRRQVGAWLGSEGADPAAAPAEPENGMI